MNLEERENFNLGDENFQNEEKYQNPIDHSISDNAEPDYGNDFENQELGSQNFDDERLGTEETDFNEFDTEDTDELDDEFDNEDIDDEDLDNEDLGDLDDEEDTNYDRNL